jgi:hypothetical protein
MNDFRTRSAYNFGCYGQFLKKEDGTRYTIKDWMKDRNITDQKEIDRVITEYHKGFDEFIRLQSCIS